VLYLVGEKTGSGFDMYFGPCEVHWDRHAFPGPRFTGPCIVESDVHGRLWKKTKKSTTNICSVFVQFCTLYYTPPSYCILLLNISIINQETCIFFLAKLGGGHKEKVASATTHQKNLALNGHTKKLLLLGTGHSTFYYNHF
jgi:hypothetical protein